MILRTILRMVLVHALCFGMLALPVFVAMSHLAIPSQAEEVKRHKLLDTVEIKDHGHSHDDGEDHEQQAGHKHGHDPADHSHQIVFASHPFFMNFPVGSDAPHVKVPGLVPLETDFGIERPPKRPVLA